VILKDDRSAASLTADRYDYIRGLQGEIKLPPSLILPGDDRAKQLPPIETNTTRVPLGK
jgi:hypothetical protein